MVFPVILRSREKYPPRYRLISSVLDSGNRLAKTCPKIVPAKKHPANKSSRSNVPGSGFDFELYNRTTSLRTYAVPAAVMTGLVLAVLQQCLF